MTSSRIPLAALQRRKLTKLEFRASIFRNLHTDLLDTRVVFVMGARQVGKSTLVSGVAAKGYSARLLTLDDQVTRNAALTDPAGFVAGLDRPVVLDEVQRAPDLLLAINETVDGDTRPGQFLLTGSANVLSNRKVKDALTGRMEIITLWPLAQSEIRGSRSNLIDALLAGYPPRIDDAPVGRSAFVDVVASGGYPEARNRSGRRRDRWFRDYVDTTLDRDLRDISDAYKLNEMPRLLRLLATQAAGLLNYKTVADRLQLHPDTVKSYVQLLETVFLVYRLQAWRPGLGAREVHAPKVNIVDSGLLAHLLGADADRIRTDDQVTGKVLEISWRWKSSSSRHGPAPMFVHTTTVTAATRSTSCWRLGRATLSPSRSRPARLSTPRAARGLPRFVMRPPTGSAPVSSCTPAAKQSR